MSNETRKEPRYRLKLPEPGAYWTHQAALDAYCFENEIDFVVDIEGTTMRFFAPGVSIAIQELVKTLRTK